MNFGDMIDIKDISGKTRLSIPINKGAKGKFTLMKEDYIILPFSVAKPVQFKLGDYVDLSGVLDESLGGKLAKIYEITDLQKPTYNTSTGGYDYNLQMNAYYWKWKNKIFKYTPEHAGNEASWSLTAALDVQLGVFLRNLKALGYTYRGADFTFSIDDTVENKAVAMTYDNMNLLDALFSMAGEDKWNCDCWITDNVIHFGRNEFGDAVKIERGVEASSITRSESQGTYATRIYAFGSTKNIPTNYRPTDEQAVVNGVVQKRLMLPADTPYIDAYEGMSQEEAIEDVVVFDDVYPRRVGTLSDVHTRTEEVKNEDGTKETITYYRYKDAGLEFKEEYILEGEELKIQFQSGKLNGMEFGVIFNPKPKDESRGDQLWEIVRNEDYGRPLPDDMMYPANGDEYILSGFDIQLVSDQYIPEAEQELKGKAQKYADKVKKDDGTYPTTLRSSWVKEDLISRTFEFGQRINLVDDTYFENGRISRVLGWEMNLDIPWDSPVYTIGESMPYSRIGEIESDVESLTYKGQTYFGKGGVYLIKVNDSTAPSDSNTFSALRALKMFLRKDQSDGTSFLLKLLGGAEFGKNGFASGLTGYGAKIDENGNVEAESLTSRRFIETPELRYNRVDVKVGDKWRAPGAGIIESVDTESKICTLKLEEGEIGAVAVGDICMGIFHSLTSSQNATGDTDDSRGNRTFAGFCTVYFTITEVNGSRNEQFKYQIRPVSERWKYSFDPFSQMNFVAYGSFTREDRQTSVYETRTYTRHLWKQNTWEIGVANIAKQSGDLSNLNIFGLNMEGYSEYTNSVYFTGTVTQVKPDGTPIITANDRGSWPPEDNHADFYDRFSYDGCLWLCVAENGTDTTPSKDNPHWLLQVDKGSQGDQGESFTLLGPWYDGLVVPKLGVVTMGGSSFAAKVVTNNPPLWTLKDNVGNRLKTESGYLLTGEINTAEYDILAEKGEQGQKGLDGLQGEKGEQGIPGEKGADGKASYFHLKYSESPDGNPMTETPSTYIGTYVDFEQADSDDYTKYTWARFKGLQGEKGDQGIPGYNGVDGKTYYLHLKYSNDGGSTFTANNGEDTGDYIGQYVDTNPTDSNTPSDYKWAKIKGDKGDKGDQGEKGEKGDGYTQMGQWYDGMAVPRMGVVTMGGSSYVAKVATANPPMWTLKDAQGNRLKTESGYILTGEINTAEYDVLAEKGDQGDKGDKGDQGIQGVQGEKGEDGAEGKQGIQGCVVRDSEWAIGTEYRNDSNITDGSLDVRFIDVVLVANEATETGWDAYQCLKTHVSSKSITYNHPSYWSKFGTNVGAIFTSLIVAKNAKIRFLQGNQLTIQKTDGTVTAGISGSDEGEKIRFWAGSETPDDAPFRVNEQGEVWANNAHITGNISCKSLLLQPSNASEGEVYNNYLISLDNYIGRKFPKVNVGEVRKFEFFVPVISRTLHSYDFIGEDDTVKFSIRGDILTRYGKNIHLPSIDGCYFNIIGVGNTDNTTMWNLFPIGNVAEQALDGATITN